jgi:hypothetical protein
VEHVSVIDSLFGPRRDDPAVVRYVRAVADARDAEVDDDEKDRAVARARAAARALPGATLGQLRREGHRL